MDNNIALFESIRHALDLGRGVDGAIRESGTMLDALHKIVDNEPSKPAKAVKEIIDEADRAIKASNDNLLGRLRTFLNALADKLGVKANNGMNHVNNMGLTGSELVNRYLSSGHFDSAAKIRILNNLGLDDNARRELINAYVRTLKYRQYLLGDSLGHIGGYLTIGNYYKKLSPEFIWLSIIDNATTDFCKAHNKEVYSWSGNYILPPAHYNCRSTIAPYISGMDIPTDEELRAMVAELK